VWLKTYDGNPTGWFVPKHVFLMTDDLGRKTIQERETTKSGQKPNSKYSKREQTFY